MKFLPTPKPMPEVDSSIPNGVELAGVVLVFFLIGMGIDLWRGTTPWFMVGMTLFGVVGQFTKMYFAYTERMKKLEAQRTQSARGVQP